MTGCWAGWRPVARRWHTWRHSVPRICYGGRWPASLPTTPAVRSSRSTSPGRCSCWAATTRRNRWPGSSWPGPPRPCGAPGWPGPWATRYCAPGGLGRHWPLSERRSRAQGCRPFGRRDTTPCAPCCWPTPAATTRPELPLPRCRLRQSGSATASPPAMRCTPRLSTAITMAMTRARWRRWSWPWLSSATTRRPLTCDCCCSATGWRPWPASAGRPSPRCVRRRLWPSWLARREPAWSGG